MEGDRYRLVVRFVRPESGRRPADGNARPLSADARGLYAIG